MADGRDILNERETPGASRTSQWLLWQVVDSAFPTGGFAHSAGVEAMWQHGMLSSGDEIAAFLHDLLRQAACASLPITLAVLREPAQFEKWDAFFDASLTNHVANRASRAQGRALLATAAGSLDFDVLRNAADRARFEKWPTHLAPTFGLVAGVLAIDSPCAAEAFLFMTIRGAVSAAVRLGAIGPMEGQRLQAAVAPAVAGAVEVALATPPDEICQSAFMMDLLQGTQDRLYSRLFQS